MALSTSPRRQVPTRALAVQVAAVFDELCAPIGRSAAVVARRHPLRLEAATAALVGTPGALANYRLPAVAPHVTAVVVDEADAVMGSTSRQALSVLGQFRRLRGVRPQPGAHPEREAAAGEPRVAFFGATIPDNGGKVPPPPLSLPPSRPPTHRQALAAQLRSVFPGISELATPAAHGVCRRVQQSFVPLDGVGDAADATLEVLRTMAPLRTGALVFANSAESAVALAAQLACRGGTEFEVLQLHARVSPADASAAVGRAARGAAPGERMLVVVCTDLAARGLDLGGVRRVVQADFPLDVVSYMHRVGRVGRAGTSGKVSAACLVPPDGGGSLAQALMQRAAGETVQGMFSRKRGWRRRQKRI